MVNTLRTRRLRLSHILLLAIVLRVAAALYLGDQVVALPGTSDQVSYHALALRVLDGHGFTFAENWWPMTAAGAPTAHWSFLYTGYLVFVYTLFGPHALAARLIQAVVVGLLQPYLAYLLAAQIYRSVSNRKRAAASMKTVALAAAAITATYPYFVYYAATLMTEPFYFTAILAALYLSIRLLARAEGAGYWRLAFGLGLALSAAVLLRQLFLLFVPLLALWLLFFSARQGNGRRALAAVAIAAAVVIFSILPLTAYNYTRFDRFVLLNTNAGYAFYLANHPAYGTRFRPASEMGTGYQELIPAELRELDEAALDQELLKRGVEFVLEDPGRYVRLSISRLPEYFKFWPDPDSGRLSNITRVASFGLFLPFMLYGIVEPLVRRDRRTGGVALALPSPEMILLYLFMLAYTAIHIFSWAQIRYRLPVDAILVIFAAGAVVAAWEWATGRAGQWAGRQKEGPPVSLPNRLGE